MGLQKLHHFLYASVSIFMGLGGMFAIGLLGWDFYFPGPFRENRLVGDFPIWIDVALIVAFGLQHSIMARPGFKKMLSRTLTPPLIRTSYIMFTGFFLFLLVALWQPVFTPVWDASGGVGYYILLGGAGLGFMLIVWAGAVMNGGELIGITALQEIIRGAPIDEGGFRTPGPYAFVRHPLYTGILLMIWCVPVSTVDHLVFAIGFTLYIFVGTWFEERQLRRDFGEAYQQYQRRVGAFFPRPAWGSKS